MGSMAAHRSAPTPCYAIKVVHLPRQTAPEGSTCTSKRSRSVHGRCAPELGELLTGAAEGRRSDGELTVAKSLGLAADDLAAVEHLCTTAPPKLRSILAGETP